MIDLSDADNIVKRLVFNIIDNNVETGYSVEHLVWDWESDLMNQLLDGTKRPIRASARYITMKNRCCSGEYCHFMWNGVETFDEMLLSPVPKANEKGSAFVGDGELLMISTSEVPFIERGKSKIFTMEKCTEVPSVTYNTTDFCTVITIPCSNVLERDYSLTAFYASSNVFLFDLKSDKFSTTPIQFIHPDNLFYFKEAFIESCIVPYLEGSRMRVFVCQKERLFELVWSGEEFKSPLQMIRHLEFVQSVFSITRMDNIGLLVRSKDINQKIQYHIYEPELYNSNQSQKEGIWRFITNVDGNLSSYLYAPKSKSLVYRKGIEYTKYLSFEEIMKMPSNRIREVFDEENFEKFKEYDASFNVYTPRCKSKAIEKVTFVKPNQRINEAYQIKLEHIDHIEIVAGINCKEFAEKLGQFISKDYVELTPTDLADYLGAPLVYLHKWGGNNLSHEYFIRDMQYHKRTSSVIELGKCLNGGLGGSTTDISNLTFLGIVQGKPFDSSEEDNAVEEEEEAEYQQLFKNTQFRMESNTMLATDPFLSDGGVYFENVREGLWQWNTTNKQQGYCDGGYFDPNVTAQFVAVHTDYLHLLNTSNIWLIPKDRTEEYGGEYNRNEYLNYEMEGGWFQMRLGVSSDCAVVGLFDQKYFNDENVLPASKVRQKSLLEANFKLCYEPPYQEYLTKKMEEEGFPDKMEMPYGIITSSGYGDGYYPTLFKKSEKGDVIAVKIFFA
ncbi:predicted protein [Naegleria gruberi]|uniref:Predicted protein n=1 Tax=Naegleria gruberi TaxID=5762 RepID=D2W3R7_NAEGR|nr:uncharacterized protein NAEGRDRAFT_82265 [Naegleria gruberi]EFC36284.1 predicted protein [Naegleria gruberi]|eukprot:XP_002669028.1 predicted protein [Naegleria gruberi strain NEG-M]